jgi:hypothetical protein
MIGAVPMNLASVLYIELYARESNFPSARKPKCSDTMIVCNLLIEHLSVDYVISPPIVRRGVPVPRIRTLGLTITFDSLNNMSDAHTTTTASTSPKAELAKALAQRPDREELVERNILPSE